MKITAANTFTYILLRSDSATEALFYIRRAFSPIKNTVKLANGRQSYDCLWTNNNYIMSYCQCTTKPAWFKNTIKQRIEEFGIEATEELIEETIRKAAEIMSKLK